jgi:DNA repair exonuclease SbcCD ATPase subunit
MFKEVILNNFKGRTEVVKLSRYNLFCGANGSGKSAIPEALILARTGYVKGVKRQNQEVYHTMFSDADDPFSPVEHSVGFVYQSDEGEIEFKRGFKAGKSGTITQVYSVNGDNVSKDAYNEMLVTHRVPGIFDIEEFMDFSDEKKINAIFKRFGDPGDDPKIDSKIANSKAEVNRLNDLIRTNNTVAQKLSVSRAEYELPDGSLAEINNEIEKIEAEKKLAVKHLTNLKVEEGKREAEEETKRKMAEAEDAVKDVFTGSQTVKKALDEKVDEVQKETQDFVNRQVFDDGFKLDPRDSIQKIIMAIKSVGCVMCSNGTGIMVAKRELKRYEVDHEAN